MAPLSPSASLGSVILQAEVQEMRGDSSSGNGFVDFIESIKKWGVPIVGVIVFIFGMPKVFDAAKGNITWSVLSVVGVIWLLLFWVYTSKLERLVSREGQLPKKDKSPRFPMLRKWALAGMIALPILTLSGIVIADYIERRPSNKTVILIADFQGPDQKFAVTQVIINRMKRAVSEFPEVEIKPLGEVIKEGTESATVRRIGADHKASIVVWGFYDEAMNGTAHIDQVRQMSSFSLRRNELDFNVTLPEGRGISAQEALSGDMSLLALLVVGVARYDAGAYDEAIGRFTKALDQLYSSRSEGEVSDVKFFLGKSLYQKGKYREAVDRLQEVELKRDGDPDVLGWLGLALQNAARYAEAVPLYQRSLAIREKALGPEHPDTAQSLNNLAGLYYSQGKYAEAEPLHKRSLAIREKALGPEHSDTAQSLNDLALLYDLQGKYAEAEPLYKRSLAIREKALGPEHSDTANSLNNLAGLYDSQGKYTEAEPLYKRSLAIKEKTLGPEHPSTAQSFNNLGVLNYVQGRYAEAEPLYKRALAIREKTLGPEHTDTANSLNNLALLYKSQGKYAEAEPLLKRSLAIRENALDPGHPDIAQSLNNLAYLYNSQGRYAEAEPLYKRTLAITEKALGPEHPYTATSLNNLASLYYSQEKYVEAEPLHKRALAIYVKALGPEHPDTVLILNNLALLYDSQGRYVEAEPLYQRALAIREKVLGPEHRDTAQTLENYAALLRKLNRESEAAKLETRAKGIREKTNRK